MPTLTHGPIIGATTDTSVVIWLRADGPAAAELIVSTADKRHAQTRQLEAGEDFTAVFSFTHLAPDQRYHYQVKLDGVSALAPELSQHASFRTFPPAAEEASDFSFTFGSCFNYLEDDDSIFQNLIPQNGDHSPRFFLMIGDNVYADYYIDEVVRGGQPALPNLLEAYRAVYRHTWNKLLFRRALMGTPAFMIFDDHEIWNNWQNLPAHRDDAEGFPAAKQAYWEYQDRHNPGAESRHRSANPIYHYTFSYGRDIGFFVLDCRMQRDPEAIPFPVILGDKQRRALYAWLRENNERYRLKFIVSSVPISFIALPHAIVKIAHGELGDQWLGYPEERRQLFKFFQEEKISGVHFLSGDIHLGQGLRINPIPEAAASPVYAYTSSPLANTFYLLPETMPGWFSTFISLVIGLGLGLLIAQLTALVTLVGGLALGLTTGILLAWIWRRWYQARPQKRRNPSRLEKGIYNLLRSIVHNLYFRRLTGIAADRIKAGAMYYEPESLFPAVNNNNMGLVQIKRNQEKGTLSVQFSLLDPQGNELAAEETAHHV
jgi:alkaline phosphatase D